MESESDPLTRRPVDLFEKEPLKGNSEVHLHTPTKFGEDRSKDLGGDREQTDRQTDRQTDKRCSIYSMILVSVVRDKSRPQIKLYHFTKLIFILCLLKIISTDYLFVVVIFDGYNDNRRRQQCHSADRDDCINRRKYTGQPTQP